LKWSFSGQKEKKEKSFRKHDIAVHRTQRKKAFTRLVRDG
jgi:hypothetical protein